VRLSQASSKNWPALQLRGKIKNREKIEKSVDAFLALPLEATFHI
jgi:hypothetical protein